MRRLIIAFAFLFSAGFAAAQTGCTPGSGVTCTAASISGCFRSTINCTFNCSVIVTPTLYVHAHHN